MGTNTYHRGRVTAVRRLTPHMARITFAAPSLASAGPAAPDAYLKVFFPRPGEAEPRLPPPLTDEVTSWYRGSYLAMPDDVRPPMRTYTVRAARPDTGEVDVDFVLHEDDGGPASTWAARAGVRDTIAFLGPYGRYDVPEGTSWQLLAGDQTALPAIGAILESLPTSARAVVYVEVSDPEERQAFDTRGAVELHWVINGEVTNGAIKCGGRPHGEALLDALRAADFPGGVPYAWISGEAGMVKQIRRHLVRERGFDRRAICFTGYWRQGMSEEAVARANVEAALVSVQAG